MASKTSFHGPLIIGSTSQTISNPFSSGKIKNIGICPAIQVSGPILFNSGANYDTGIVIPKSSQIVSIKFFPETAFTGSSTTSITLGGYTQNTAQGRPIYVPIGIGLTKALAISATETGPLDFEQITIDSWYSNSAANYFVEDGDSKIYATITANSASAGQGRVYISYIQGYWDLLRENNI